MSLLANREIKKTPFECEVQKIKRKSIGCGDDEVFKNIIINYDLK